MWEAYLAGTIPVGAVLADEQRVIVSRGRNRIFTAPTEGALGGTRLGHAEINALIGLPTERTYPELTLYSSLEPCHLCLSAATMSRIGAVRYAANDPYAGAVGKLLESEYTRRNPVRVEGPLPGSAGRFPELLHLRHMLWRVPDSPGLGAYYRRVKPDFVELALRIPAPSDATTLDDAFARVSDA